MEKTGDLMLSLHDLYEYYRKWRDPAGIFECFVKATCFVSLRHYPDFEVKCKAPKKDGIYQKISEYIIGAQKCASADNKKTLYMIDFPAVKALAAAVLLNREAHLFPILTMRELYHPCGIVGSQAQISALLTYAPMLTVQENKGYVFILDSNRRNESDIKNREMKFDNQYDLTPFDLPTLEMLYDAGYQKLLFFHAGAIKQDAADYIGNLRLSGFTAKTIRIEGH